MKSKTEFYNAIYLFLVLASMLGSCSMGKYYANKRIRFDDFRQVAEPIPEEVFSEANEVRIQETINEQAFSQDVATEMENDTYRYYLQKFQSIIRPV